MNKFMFMPHLFGLKLPTPIFLIKNGEIFNKEYSNDLFPKDKHMDYKINGYIFLGESQLFSKKNVLISYYKNNNNLICEFLQVESDSTTAMQLVSLFKFVLTNSYEIKNTYFGLINFFSVRNISTNKIEFSFYYYHPYNRTLMYGGDFEDMYFKELAENYQNEQWKNEMLAVFIN